MPFSLHSSSFANNETIPATYTAEGKDISPPLAWKEAPAGTVSFALIVDDPDAPDPQAPTMTWVHWILYNIPASTHELKEGILSKNLPQGAKEGINDFGTTLYGGPNPPIGKHRYFFKLYALSKKLPDIPNLMKKDLENAMRDAIIGKAVLVGTYEKKK